MSRDPRDLQKDLEILELGGRSEDDFVYGIVAPHAIERVIAAEDQVKQLKEDNVRLTCKHTAAEQKYLTQSNVIAELRDRVEKAEVKAENWRNEAFRKYPTPDAYEAVCMALDKHRDRADHAEEREQKLKAAVEKIAPTAWNGGEEYLRKVLSSLYPLKKEDTTNEMDPL